MTQTKQPLKLVGFLCNWCSYAGSDLAGTARLHYDISLRAIRVMCSGRVEPAFVLKAFQEGADGVIIAGCQLPADCHYTSGNFKALSRYETFLPLLDAMGIERERLQLHWISASEGEKFAQVMNDFSATINRLGPLDLERVRSHCPLRSSDHLVEPDYVCPIMRAAQEFAACEAASSGLLDLDERRQQHEPIQRMAPSIRYQPDLCIRCGSCVEACALQGVEALRLGEQGIIVDEQRCLRCGQCILSCPLSFPDKTIAHVNNLMDCQLCAYARPAGAFSEQDDLEPVLAALDDPAATVVIEVAPAVRSTIGEAFGIAPGALLTRRLYTALRQAGFDRVWDTNFTADLTIMEEGTELINRLQAPQAALPQLTSCCPAWVRFVENHFPQLIPHLSSAKSPQQMFGAVAKTFGARHLSLDPRRLFVVSAMPCTAKKHERSRSELCDAARYWQEQDRYPTGQPYPDVDAVLTTRELARLLKHRRVNLAACAESDPDALFGDYSGAATLFGRTGGVMTAALRTAYEALTGQAIPDLDLQMLAEDQGIKTATLRIGEQDVRVAVVYGLQNARLVCSDILRGGDFARYHFIEVMTCPGGCVGGGGQIITTNRQKTAERASGLNCDDQLKPTRTAHANAAVQTLYDRFLGSPCSDLAHHLLHTAYTDRQRPAIRQEELS
jgi:iron-only hydrogenase group A